LFYWEYQVPVLTPDHIAIVNSETVEFTGVKIFVVLRMWMTADKISDINQLCCIVAECQINCQVSCIFSLYNIQFLDSSSSL